MDGRQRTSGIGAVTSPTVVDAIGVAHPVAADGARILSLVPSLTELLFDLGLGERVVGRTAFCVHPQPAVKSVGSVGGTKRVNMDKVRAVAASHVLVNVDETPRELADELADLGLEVVVTHPIEVADNVALFRMIGDLFGAARAAETLADRLMNALDRLQARARHWPERRVLYLIWTDPWMTVSRDTYISRLLASAGWHTVAGDTDARYPQIDLEPDLLDHTDLILLASEPFAFTAEHGETLAAAFPAAAGKLRFVDGERLSWYGSRAIEGLRYLGRIAAAENQ